MSNKPLLIKLHGDAKSNNCVATMRGISDAKRLASHHYLQNLLSNKKILVLGYSGFGDIDIAPHLEKANAHLIWAVRDLDSQVPSFVRNKILCDLHSEDINKNILLGLAYHYGWRGKIIGKDHQWKNLVNRWCKEVGKDSLAKIVTLTIFGQIGWPSVHLSHFTSLPVINQEKLVAKGISCLQISAYSSAEEYFNKALSSEKITLEQSITTRVYLGLAQWRHGNLEKALDTLWPFLELSFKRIKKQQKFEVGDGLRLYLEIARDLMQYTNNQVKRREIFRTRRMDEVINRLEKIPKADVKASILAQLAFFHIYHLLRQPVKESDVNELFEDCFNAMIWGTAEAVGRLYILISFWKGLSALIKVDRKLFERRNWNTLRKSFAAIIHAIFREKVPLILSVLDGQLMGILMTRFREASLRRNRKLWDKEREKEIINLY